MPRRPVLPSETRIGRSGRRHRHRTAGQSLIEYVVVLGVFIGIALVLIFFLSFFMGHGWRILHLIGLEYP
jgi:hypothetical protein